MYFFFQIPELLNFLRQPSCALTQTQARADCGVFEQRKNQPDTEKLSIALESTLPIPSFPSHI